MIVRIWSASATPDGARKYRTHFERHVVPGLRELAGFLGAYVLEREQDAIVLLEVHTMWTSFDAVRAFATRGTIEAAVIHPEALAVLISHDDTVRHYAAHHYAATFRDVVG